MNSIDNILKYIEKKTEEEIFEIKNKTLKECEKILNKSKIMKEHKEKFQLLKNKYEMNLTLT